MNYNVFTRKINRETKWLVILTVIPLYMFGGSLIGNALLKYMIIHFSLNLDLNTMNAYLNFFVDLGMFLFAAYIFKESLKEQFIDFKNNLKDNLLYGCIIGLACLYLVGIIGGIITMVLGGADQSENQNLINSIAVVHPIIMFFTTVILAPMLEEIVFRGMIFGWLYELNPKIAHLFSAFLFGFVHIMISVINGNMAEWVQIFSYFFMGFVLSWLYEKKNNIFVPMLTHSMNNLISMIAILFIN